MARGAASPSRAKRRSVPKRYRYVIDDHGLVRGLENRSNSLIAAIQSGEVAIMRSASHLIRDAYPALYPALQALDGKKLVDLTLTLQAEMGVLMESYGARALGGIPGRAYFEAAILAKAHSATLVTHAKGLSVGRGIVSHLGGTIISVDRI